jgi:hypothetical protein
MARATDLITFEPCRLKAGLKTRFHPFRAPHRDMFNSYEIGAGLLK